MQEECKYLFTYGTLRDSNVNHKAHFLKEHAIYAGKGFIQASLYKVTWYPAINLDEGSENKVYGEIYELPLASREIVLHELDGYEGIYGTNEESEEYERVKVQAFLENQASLECWVYNYKHRLDTHQRIASGDYLKYLETQI